MLNCIFHIDSISVCKRLRLLRSQLCPISLKSPSSSLKHIMAPINVLEINESAITLFQDNSAPWPTALFSNNSSVWELPIHAKNALPNFDLLGILPRAPCTLSSQARFSETALLMFTAREITQESQAQKLLCNRTLTHEQNILTLRHYEVNRRLLFHRRSHEWQEGIVSKLYLLTIFLS